MKNLTIKQLHWIQKNKTTSATEFKKNVNMSKAEALREYEKLSGDCYIFMKNNDNQIVVYTRKKIKCVSLEEPYIWESPSQKINISLEYESKSSKYGSYNPHQYLNIRRLIRTKYGTYLKKETIELCHGSTVASLRKSNYARTFEIKTCKNGVSIFENRIVFGKYQVTFEKFAKKGSVLYHGLKDASNMYLKDALMQKIDIQKKKKIDSKISRKNKITVNEVQKNLGFCDTGINDFKTTFNLSGNSIDLDDLLSLDFTKTEDYRDDIATLIRYAKNKKRGMQC